MNLYVWGEFANGHLWVNICLWDVVRISRIFLFLQNLCGDIWHPIRHVAKGIVIPLIVTKVASWQGQFAIFSTRRWKNSKS